jgi:hypothetical protein
MAIFELPILGNGSVIVRGSRRRPGCHSEKTINFDALRLQGHYIKSVLQLNPNTYIIFGRE